MNSPSKPKKKLKRRRQMEIISAADTRGMGANREVTGLLSRPASGISGISVKILWVSIAITCAQAAIQTYQYARHGEWPHYPARVVFRRFGMGEGNGPDFWEWGLDSLSIGVFMICVSLGVILISHFLISKSSK